MIPTDSFENPWNRSVLVIGMATSDYDRNPKRNWKISSTYQGSDKGTNCSSMVVSGYHKRWEVAYNPPAQKAIYKWYKNISGIYCQLGDYMLPTTY